MLFYKRIATFWWNGLGLLTLLAKRKRIIAIMLVYIKYRGGMYARIFWYSCSIFMFWHVKQKILSHIQHNHKISHAQYSWIKNETDLFFLVNETDFCCIQYNSYIFYIINKCNMDETLNSINERLVNLHLPYGVIIKYPIFFFCF